jgi:hypothetical protein
MRETIAAARAAIAANAAKYTPKNTVHWIIWEDDEGNGEEYEGSGFEQNLVSDTPIRQDDYFCEDCIEVVLADLSADPTADRPEGFARFSFREWYMPEEESFVICAKCGHLIEVSIVWSEQELDDWLRDDQAFWAEAISSPSVCWEIAQILHEDYGAAGDFPDETLRVAKRVLDAVASAA